jgi:predicted DNA-binding transcriptional regulator AlpA
MSLTDRTVTLSPSETAARLGVRESTLANWRWSGRGPRHCKVGSRVRYLELELAEWLESQTRLSTSDDGSHV